ncbi:molybdopterin-binding oxidoreductase [Sphingomonas sp. DBB INV C78]
MVDLADGRITGVHGARDNPVYHGYSCIKGREAPALLTLPSRLLHSLRRTAECSFEQIGSEQAAGEVGQRIATIAAEHGPRSIGLYVGTYGHINLPAFMMAMALMRAIDSPMIFTSLTIDQPGKITAPALHGNWLGGVPPQDRWDALLLLGANPVVSQVGGLGMNPARNLKRSRARGMKLVVVDPRRTDCAAVADVHVQPRAGEDAAILACLIREILRAPDGVDAAFVAAECEGLEALRSAVEPFTPERVAARGGVPAAALTDAAQVLIRAKSGAVFAGTGGNMSGHPTLVEYLGRIITSLRGWYLRAGDARPNPGVFINPPPPLAAAAPPSSVLGAGRPTRVRGLSETAAGMPTAALAEEILVPGEGRIRALIVLGGNPVMAWPDEAMTTRAMRELDLLVCVDPKLTATAALADYVLAPRLGLEIMNTTAHVEIASNFGAGMGFDRPYGQVAPALTEPPAGSDVLEEWEYLHAIAATAGLQLSLDPASTLDPVAAAELGTKLDMDQRPTSEAIWRMLVKSSPVPFDDVAATPGGRLFDRRETIQPKPDGWAGRLQIGDAMMMAELAALAAEDMPAVDDDFPFQLLSRRLNDVMNSSWHDNPKQGRRWRRNPAFIHPADMERLSITAGEDVAIESRHGRVVAVAEPADDVRPGCISMSHGWGQSDASGRLGGEANAARLIATDRDFDALTGIPRMSGFAVRVAPLA